MSLTHYSIAFSKTKLLALPSSTARLAIVRYMSKTVVPEKYDPSKPIKFSTSAAGWNYKKITDIPEYPVYKEVILWGSLFSFITYLMFYRERNDFDEELDMPLGKRYLWVQELHLLNEKQKLLDSGHDGSGYDEDLKKIQDLRKKYNYT